MDSGFGAVLQIILMLSNINEVVFELVNAIGVGNDSVVFVGRNLALRHVQHALPPVNNFPLLNHTGDIGITGVYHFASLFVVPWLIDTGLGHGIGLALIGILNLLLIEAWNFHNLIQRFNLIILRLITLISLILIYCFIALN